MYPKCFEIDNKRTSRFSSVCLKNIIFLNIGFFLSVLQNKTTFRFSSLVSVRTALISDTQNPEICGYSTCQNEAKTEKKICWLVTSLPLYLKSVVVRTDHKV